MLFESVNRLLNLISERQVLTSLLALARIAAVLVHDEAVGTLEGAVPEGGAGLRLRHHGQAWITRPLGVNERLDQRAAPLEPGL